MALTWVATGVGFYFGLYNSENKLVAGLFQSWMGDVLFFSIVTVLVSIISSAPPSLESFEQRAAILFQGKAGSQIDYACSLLNRLGNYSEETRTTITIDKDEDGWFRLLAKTTTRISNLIEDVRTTYELDVVDIEQMQNPPDKIGKVLEFCVDGQVQIPLPKQPGREAAYSVEIGGDRVRQVEILLDRWIGPNGYIAHSPRRYTKHFSLEIINSLEHSVILKMEQPKRRQITLASLSRQENLVTLSDVHPLNLAYHFYLFRSSDEVSEWRKRRDKTS